MTFSLMLLGVLLICAIFNVGESVYKSLNLNRLYLIIILTLSIILYFIPDIALSGVKISCVGFALPLLFSLAILFTTKSYKGTFKIIVAMLLAFSLNLIYNLISFDVYETAILQPYIALGIFLGSASLLIVTSPLKLYFANFIGLSASEVAFYYLRYSSYSFYELTLGNQKVFSCLIISFVTSAIVYVIAVKVQKLSIARKLRKLEKEKAQS